ncbi:putative RNA 2'-phosphotransferase [Pedobacter suwonensis]|uniref:Probable RNA 2'-phosphotransferase n=1 Tax=Pedobacter suwonensis TaxID=332999 RepID=A0A1I0T142_9SPHI|nr:RNA 2'-phosphotransferase [Pedobacter suwonensis]SFA45461.1 putative RNA 2'-phosphotransferase [Pedobacter suwonensis]
MDNKITKGISKSLSYILRHSPETIKLKLDENGWAEVDELIARFDLYDLKLDFELLEYVVEHNDKKRFAFNADKTKIRANQGHSISIELDLDEGEPPSYLYHGTVEKFLPDIKAQGLQKMSRQHVHLSADKETAIKVGGRRGRPIILIINSKAMNKAGYKFYLSANNVWLTAVVPAEYITF